MKTLLLVAALASQPYDIHNWGFAVLFTVDFKGVPTRVLGGCHTRKWGMPDFQDEEVHEAVPNSVMDNWITEACNEPLDKLPKEDWL